MSGSLNAPESETGHLLIDGSPRWDAIDFDVLCSRCGYNLKTLSHPRCPECGLDFEWPAVLYQAGWRSAFLFEHQWRRRFLSSLVETAWRARRPRRFWESVSIHDRVFPRPLVFVLLCAAPTFLLAVQVVAALVRIPVEIVMFRQAGTRWFTSPLGAVPWLSSPGASLLERLDGELEMLSLGPFGYNPMGTLGFAGLVVATLALMIAVLAGLRQTLGRARVRTVHVVRIVSYSSIPIAIYWAAASVLGVSCITLIGSSSDTAELLGGLLVLGIYAIGAIVVPAVYLHAGLKHYARLPRAIALAVTAPIVAVLTTITGTVFVVVTMMGGWG